MFTSFRQHGSPGIQSMALGRIPFVRMQVGDCCAREKRYIRVLGPEAGQAARKGAELPAVCRDLERKRSDEQLRSSEECQGKHRTVSRWL